jgi:hypothetical protein
VAGIVLAFLAAFAAWWNFTLAANIFGKWADVKMLIDRNFWPQPDAVLARRMTATLYIAIVSGIASVSCLLGGSIAIWRTWA